MKITPSAPIERERSQTFSTNAGRSIPPRAPSRLSISRKSFPLPLSFENGIPFSIRPPRGKTVALFYQKRREPLPDGEVPDRFPLPHHFEPAPEDHHLRRPRARVVVGGHREAVGARAHHREEVPWTGRRQPSVL